MTRGFTEKLWQQIGRIQTFTPASLTITFAHDCFNIQGDN
jgi:hypothetical protein